MTARALTGNQAAPTRLQRLRAWYDNPEPELDLRRWIPVAVVIALVGGIMREPVLVLLALLVLMFAIGVRLWWDWCMTNLTYTRTLSKTRAIHGDEVTLELTVVNAKPLPVSRLEVVDELTSNISIADTKLERTDRANVHGLRTFFSLGLYERVNYRFRIPAQRRGLHRVGPATLVASDPFGMVSRRTRISEYSSFIVYPRIVPVSTVVVPARQPFGDFKPVQPIVEDPMRMSGVRQYVAGDSPRRIHWKASARTGTLQTRVYEPSASPIAAVFLDTITFSHMWEGQNSRLLELAITVAASISHNLLDTRHQVGLYANAPIPLRSRTVRIPPSRRPGQLARILEQLALMQSVYGDRIERLVAEETPKLPWGATVVMITTNVTESMQRTLLRLARSGGGGRFVLIALGDVPEVVPELRRRLSLYHLGGEESWDEIQRIAFTRLQ